MPITSRKKSDSLGDCYQSTYRRHPISALIGFGFCDPSIASSVPPWAVSGRVIGNLSIVGSSLVLLPAQSIGRYWSEPSLSIANIGPIESIFQTQFTDLSRRLLTKRLTLAQTVSNKKIHPIFYEHKYLFKSR